MQKTKNKSLWICLLTSGLTAVLSFLPFVLQGKGMFTLIDDFNEQQLTFSMAVQQVLKSEIPGQWCWNLDLGSSLINAFGFYNLGSPFFWLSCLFPIKAVPYLMAPLFVLKYMVAAVTAFYYIKRFTKTEKFAVIGALLYAFSGFQATNILYNHFHDVVAFFPLLLLGLEKSFFPKEEEKANVPFFIFAIFINAVLNYFFFIQEVVFLILYFLFKCVGKRDFWKKLGGCVLCGILGVGMSAVLFLPGILYVLESNRMAASGSSFLYSIRGSLFILKGMFLPGDTQNLLSAIEWNNWDSTSCYLPFIGMVPAISYIFGSSRKDRLKWFLSALTICSFSPFLQSLFLLGTFSYQRWWYMYVLILALASTRVLEEPASYPLKRSVLANTIILAVLVICAKWIPFDENIKSLIFWPKKFWSLCIMAAVGVLGTFLVTIKGKTKWGFLIGGVLLCSLCTTIYSIYYYREWDDRVVTENSLALGEALKNYDDQYRYNCTENLLMLPGEAAGIGCFSSTIENTSREFDALFGHVSNNFTTDKDVPGLAELLGGKYSISLDANVEGIIDVVTVQGVNYYIVAREACPIGFAVEGTITKEDLLTYPVEYRPTILMHYAVGEETAKMESTEVLLQDFEKNAVENRVQEFTRNAKGFHCNTTYDKARLVFFTVPYSRGWKCLIDGEPEEIQNSGGMMLINVPAGKHEISFIYQTPGFHIGICMSVISFIIFCVVTFIIRKKQRPVLTGDAL